MALTVACCLVFILFAFVLVAMCRARILRSEAGATLAEEVSENNENGRY